MTELPAGWAWAMVGDVCDRAAKWDPQSEPAAEFQYIDISSIDRQRIQRTTRVVGAEAPSRARQLVRAGDTVLSTVRTYLVNTAQVPDELDEATASTGFCVLRPTGAIDRRFLFYRVIESGFVEALSRKQTGSSYPAVRDRDVFDQPIALPPLAEQGRIVAAVEEHFSRLDAAVDLVRNAAVRLQALRRGVVDAAFADGWPRVPLGEIAEVVGGVTKDSKRQQDPALTEVPYLRVANVQRGYFDLETVARIRVPPETAARLELRAGDVLFNEGGDRDKLGRGWVWPGEIPGCIHQNHVFRARLRGEFDPYFVSWWGNSFGREWFWRHGRQTTNLASMSLSTLKAFPVPAPSLNEQRAAVDEIEHRLSAVDHLAQVAGTSQVRAAALRRSILARAFRGELVPQEAEAESAHLLLERIAAERVASPARTRKRRMRTPA